MNQVDVSAARAARLAAEIQAVAVGYYERQLSPETLVWYYDDLKEYDIERVRWALREHVRTPIRCRRMPLPGDLIELLGEDRKTRADLAWQHVVRSIRTRGRYAAVTFQDEATERVVYAMGGWKAICDCPSERELEQRRDQFMRMYEQAPRSGIESASAARLVMEDRRPGGN